MRHWLSDMNPSLCWKSVFCCIWAAQDQCISRIIRSFGESLLKGTPWTLAHVSTSPGKKANARLVDCSDLRCSISARAIRWVCCNSKPTKINEPIMPITPRKLAAPVNDIATGIFESIPRPFSNICAKLLTWRSFDRYSFAAVSRAFTSGKYISPLVRMLSLSSG